MRALCVCVLCCGLVPGHVVCIIKSYYHPRQVSIMLVVTTLCALARFSLLSIKVMSIDMSFSFHSVGT